MNCPNRMCYCSGACRGELPSNQVWVYQEPRLLYFAPPNCDDLKRLEAISKEKSIIKKKETPNE